MLYDRAWHSSAPSLTDEAKTENSMTSIGSKPTENQRRSELLGGGRRGWNGRAEEVREDGAQRVYGLRGVDRRAQVRPVLDALRVPRTESSDLVDHPPVVSGRL